MIWTARGCLAMLFPGIRAGASLKRRACGRLRWRSELFPGIRAGASLKLGRLMTCLPVVRDSRLFPGIRAGASLKPRGGAYAAAARQLFPGIRAGASLKPVVNVFGHDYSRGSSPAFVPGPH